jgi:hypothetical protein
MFRAEDAYASRQQVSELITRRGRIPSLADGPGKVSAIDEGLEVLRT